MPECQLRLFLHPKPLLERFGREFFKAVPRCPGVYIMRNEVDRVLYVGQSRNLRVRLSTYKNANPAHLSRKTIRLLHQVCKIDFEQCYSPIHARLRENQLLRLHRPKFNSLNVYPQAYCFIGLSFGQTHLSLSLAREQIACHHLYGAFKRQAVLGFAALVRLLWSAIHQPLSPSAFPCGMLHPRALKQYVLSLLHRADLMPMARMLPPFLEGRSDEFINLLPGALPGPEKIPRFQQMMHETDLEILGEFYHSGPLRNFILRERHHLTDHVIPQQRLDDLLTQ